MENETGRNKKVNVGGRALGNEGEFVSILKMFGTGLPIYTGIFHR